MVNYEDKITKSNLIVKEVILNNNYNFKMLIFKQLFNIKQIPVNFEFSDRIFFKGSKDFVHLAEIFVNLHKITAMIIELVILTFGRIKSPLSWQEDLSSGYKVHCQARKNSDCLLSTLICFKNNIMCLNVTLMNHIHLISLKTHIAGMISRSGSMLRLSNFFWIDQ